MTIESLPTVYLVYADKTLLWLLMIGVAVVVTGLFVLTLTRHAAAASMGYRIGLERGRQEAPADAKVRIDDLLVRANRVQADYDRVVAEKQAIIEEDAELRGLMRRMLQQARRDANRMIDNMGNRDAEIEELIAPKGKRRSA